MTGVAHADVVPGIARGGFNPAIAGAGIRHEGNPSRRVKRSRPVATSRSPWVRIGPAVAVAVVLLGAGLFHVWVRLQVTELGYGLSTIREIVARLENEQRELETELAMLTAPQQLAEEARRRLEMREPKAGQVVVLR